jgi:drug/metabolite transporter (DMT)-like permease
MGAILLGVAAALAWGIHDFLIRFLSRSLGSLQAVLIVLVAGAGVLAVAMLAVGEPLRYKPEAMWMLALSGVTYALAARWLYDAFRIGPITLVAPIIGAYPVLVMIWATMTGRQFTGIDLLSVAGIMAGVALVSRFANQPSDDDDEQAPAEPPGQSRVRAITISLLSGACYAASFVSGQAAGAMVGEMSTSLIARLFAITVVLLMSAADRGSFAGLRKSWPILLLMGTLDVLALTAVVAAGHYPGAELGTVVASCFGAVTVALAVVVLKERLHALQFLGMILILAGIASITL